MVQYFLMEPPQAFEVVFSMSIITRIESIGGGRVREGWGRVGSCRWAKANIQTEMAVLCHQ